MRLPITRTVYKVSDFLSWQRGKSLVLSPSFQRRPVWSATAKSFLIDTVARGLPMPIIFLREQTNLQSLEPVREVVDGQQRLRTLISFIEPQALSDFDAKRDDFTVRRTHNRDLAGKPFRQFAPELRRSILSYEFSVHVLPSETEDREILQIFARMNSTGVRANDQELRNAEYFGAFKTLMYTLAYEQLSRWRVWKIFSETDIARMLEVEETSDLVLMMMRGERGKSQSALDKAYKDNESEFAEGPEVERRFRAVMDRIDETLGPFIEDSAFSRKTMFHTLFVFYYDAMYGIESELVPAKPSPLPSGTVSGLRRASEVLLHGELDEKLAKVLRGATGDAASRRARLEFLRETV